MWDWLKDSDTLKGIGAVGSAVANGYNAYKQSNYAKESLELQKASYNRGIEKENLAQSNFDSAIETSFGSAKKKKEPSFDIA